MKHICIALVGAAALWLVGSPIAAQEGQYEEVVVTARRLQEFDPAETPYVTLTKRADNLITSVTVVCDTRDLSQRQAELRSTLRNLVRAAASDKTIELGLGEEILGAFDESMLDKVIEPDGRKADTSRATLVIKTKVSGQDTFDSATSRIKQFVDRTPKVGRTEILPSEKWELTLIGPGRYRPDVAKLIAEDARDMAAVFGEGYGVQVSGLQLPVSWYQSGPLDLALYIPYRLEVTPLAR